MKYWIFLVLTLLAGNISTVAQDKASVNCGVNSAVSLARVLGSTIDARSKLQDKYPNAIVSLHDVRHMCRQLGLETSGVKGTLTELLQSGIPCIVGLKAPEHFLVLLDGTREEVRVLDGPGGDLQVVSHRELEARFTGFALIPEIIPTPDAPRLKMPAFDQNLLFESMGQKVNYTFPVKNEGSVPLSIEISNTSCGCTAAVLQGVDAKNIVLAPGQSSTIVVSYVVETQAPVQQTVKLKTNDPRRAEVYLSVRGQLPPQLTLSPPSLYVQQSYDERPNKSFKVIGPSNTIIKRMWSDLSYLKLDVRARDEEAVRVRWTIVADGFSQAPIGPINGKIWVELQDGKQVFVPVRGEIEEIALGAQEASQLPRAEDNPNNEIAVPRPTIKPGDTALDFTVTDLNGKAWKLSELKGKKNLLLTFFPKCFTGGCANHLSSLRDHQAAFDASDTQILAVSIDPADGEKGQKEFARQWRLPFPLIPDTQRRLAMLYGAAQNDRQLAARMTILIDKSGIVRWVDTHVHVQTHGADVLTKMRELEMVK